MKATKDMTFSEMAAELDRLRSVTEEVAPKGPRAVFVVDRGWMFAGDASETADGCVRLDNAVWIFGWQEIGFAGVVKDWKSKKVDIRPISPVEIPKGSWIFRVPVETGWGVK